MMALIPERRDDTAQNLREATLIFCISTVNAQQAFRNVFIECKSDQTFTGQLLGWFGLGSYSIFQNLGCLIDCPIKIRSCQ
jgi:hypothetical protein